MSACVPLTTAIECWYCCLHPAERTIIRQTCEGLVLTLFQGVPLPVWDAFWLATVHNTDGYREAFLSIYELQIVTIEADPTPFEAVAPRAGALSRWVGFALYVVTPDAACLTGCGQTTRPTP